MSIKEYAEEMGFTVQEVLNKCKELGINVSSADEYLSDDDFVTLDVSMNLISTDNETNFEEEDALDDAVDEILGDQIEVSEKKQKVWLKLYIYKEVLQTSYAANDYKDT